MIRDMSRDHTKFLDVLRARTGYLNPLVFYWNSNKHFSFLKAFEEQQDPTIIMDMINMIVTTNKLQAVTIDSAPSETELYFLKPSLIFTIFHYSYFTISLFHYFTVSLFSVFMNFEMFFLTFQLIFSY